VALLDELSAIAVATDNPDLMFQPFASLLRTTAEVVVLGPRVALALRPKVGSCCYCYSYCYRVLLRWLLLLLLLFTLFTS
jgi:hypothetical protein